MYKIDTLLKLNNKLFHTADLATLWGITNTNTLYTTIKRYVQKGVLISIQKGFYSTVPVMTIDPLELGVGVLHMYAYVSCESVLALTGIISGVPQSITLVSAVSKKFMIGNHQYLVRQITRRFLMSSVGIETRNGIFFATTERAIADMLYFLPMYHFDNRQLIDWKKVKNLQREIGYL